MLYILIIIISAVAQYFGPWWTMPIVCFLLCFWKSESWKSAFTTASASILTLWVGYAIFTDYTTGGVMSQKITELVFQKIPNKALLFTATGFIGSMVGGFAGLAGYHCRKAIG